MKGCGLNAHFERRAISPKCTLELVIPIGTVLIDDFLQDSLENFVGSLCQSVGLQVVRCSFLVYPRVVHCKVPNDVIDEMSTLVTDEVNWASILALEMFIHEFGRGCGRVVS